jgi:hypothetical protein
VAADFQRAHSPAAESGKIGYVCEYNTKIFWPLSLSLAILKLLRKHERLTIAELERLTEANRNTLKVRLRELMQAGQIAKYG